jgi:hypothetical protein
MSYIVGEEPFPICPAGIAWSILNFPHGSLPVFRNPRSSIMPVDLSAWPRHALPHKEVIGAAVESFVVFPEHRAFQRTRPARKQLYERIEDLGIIPNQPVALQFVRDELTELECLNICLSKY